MKSLTTLWAVVAEETAALCCASTTQDYNTVLRRVEHEGLSFLTITLPTFAKDLQKGLDRGFVGSDLFLSFKKSGKGGLPLFLGGFLRRVFDRGTGVLLDEPCHDSIFAIRQLSLLFSKILLPCSSEREKDALDKYIECEKEVRSSDRDNAHLLSEMTRVGTLVFGEVMRQIDMDVFTGTLVPKHGPGKTADKLLGNKKYDQRTWTNRLEYLFPFGENAIPSWRYSYLLQGVDFLEPGREQPCKVVLVPKTLKTPRVIAIEPTCMQYTQQAILEQLVNYLETFQFQGIVGIRDQTPNQRMARTGSLTGSLATLDLSEASDRVSNQHVRALTHHFPHFREALDATRSRKADVPGHGVVRLAKFASMGSALCFPIEAMVFTTIVFMAIEAELNTQLTPQLIHKLKSQVRVYGDDIIVPRRFARSVIDALETFGLRVNVDKSYWNGKFRESCGKEYYDGTDVSVTKVRRLLPTGRSDVPGVTSVVSLRNQFYLAGMWKTAGWLDERIQRIIRWYPRVEPTSPVLGRVSFLGYTPERVHPTLHTPQVKGYVTVPSPRSSIASGEGALLKWFLKRSDEPFVDRNHLERHGRSESVDIRLGWAPPY